MEWIQENANILLYSGAGIILLLFYIRCRRRMRTFLLGAVSGVGTLVLAHFYGGAIGFAPTLCLFNLVISAVLGIPGVLLLYLAERFI